MTTTKKLLDASQAFNNDFDGARYTMLRLSQIQSKMSQGMDDALAEFQDLMAPQSPEDGHTAPNFTEAELRDVPRIFDQMRKSGALQDNRRNEG